MPGTAFDVQQLTLPFGPHVAVSPSQLGPGLKQSDGEPLHAQFFSTVHVALQPSSALVLPSSHVSRDQGRRYHRLRSSRLHPRRSLNSIRRDRFRWFPPPPWPASVLAFPPAPPPAVLLVPSAPLVALLAVND
jgi:hypothetical protein